MKALVVGYGSIGKRYIENISSSEIAVFRLYKNGWVELSEDEVSHIFNFKGGK